MLGREVNLPLEILAGPPPNSEPESPSSYAHKLRKRLETAYDVARTNIKTETRRQKQVYDNKTHGTPFQVNDKVWLYTFQRKKGFSPKLMSFWQGPCVIKIKYSDANYLLELPSGKSTVTHFDRLKPFKQREFPVDSTPNLSDLFTNETEETHMANSHEVHDDHDHESEITHDIDHESEVTHDNHDVDHEDSISPVGNMFPLPITPNDTGRPKRIRRPPAWLASYDLDTSGTSDTDDEE